VSVPANIAEGSARQSKKDYLHFLYIAMASLTETRYLSRLARRLGFLSVENAESVEAQSRRAYGCLYGLIQAVARETGFIGKLAARSTSLAAICLARLLFRPLIT
jgi:four helix bundle protein